MILCLWNRTPMHLLMIPICATMISLMRHVETQWMLDWYYLYWCIVGENPSTFHNFLSCAGNHQYYTTNTIPIRSFCKYAYTVQDGFCAAGFLKLRHDRFCTATGTGGFNLSRNGSQNMKRTNSHCYKFSCSGCQAYRGELSPRQKIVYRKISYINNTV